MSNNWVTSSIHECLPTNAVYVGKDSKENPIYVGRAQHEHGTFTAKILPTKSSCCIFHEGQEIFKDNYDVLCGLGFTWIESSNGDVPEGAVQTGRTSYGEPLYVGRVVYEGSMTLGIIDRSEECMLLSYSGKEQRILQYEALVYLQKIEWISTLVTNHPPHGAIFAGHDIDGVPIYVGRCAHKGDILPCKAIPSKQVAYCCYDGKELAKDIYDILCNGNVSWVHSENGKVPSNAVPGGNTSCGETLYIGRVYHEGSLCVGKIHPSHQSCYTPFDGKELAHKSYEVMVQNEV